MTVPPFQALSLGHLWTISLCSIVICVSLSALPALLEPSIRRPDRYGPSVIGKYTKGAPTRTLIAPQNTAQDFRPGPSWGSKGEGPPPQTRAANTSPAPLHACARLYPLPVQPEGIGMIEARYCTDDEAWVLLLDQAFSGLLVSLEPHDHNCKATLRLSPSKLLNPLKSLRCWQIDVRLCRFGHAHLTEEIGDSAGPSELCHDRDASPDRAHGQGPSGS